jgi:hypothetical protein
MLIYVAISIRLREYAWALAELLEQDGHQVHPFPWDAEAIAQRMAAQGKPDSWINTPEAFWVCQANLEQAVTADLVVYAGGGCDAWAEVGVAVGAGVPVWGILGPGERIGMNRHMVDRWFNSALEIRDALAGLRANGAGR